MSTYPFPCEHIPRSRWLAQRLLLPLHLQQTALQLWAVVLLHPVDRIRLPSASSISASYIGGFLSFRSIIACTSSLGSAGMPR